jgi:hypothetical protein
MSTWSSGMGKSVKKDPEHGEWARKIEGWWKKFRHWLCDVGLCNLDKCKCNCHCKKRDIPNNCKDPDCKCRKG